MVQATIEGRHVPPRIQPRILTADDVLGHEQMLVGQYGAFLTQQALNAQQDNRLLASHGQVLALYPAAVLDQPGATAQWQDAHSNFPAYGVTIERRHGPKSRRRPPRDTPGPGWLFANTRLVEGAQPPRIDLSPTGINALLVPFEVQLSLPPDPNVTQLTAGSRSSRWSDWTTSTPTTTRTGWS